MTGLVLFGGMGVLFAILGIPLARRKVPPNLIYGVRTRATLRDGRVWYDANAFAGKLLMVFGALTLLLAAGLYPLIGDDKRLYAPVMVLAVAVLFAAVVAATFRYLARLGRKADP